MEKIRFAQWVIQEIAEHGIQYHDHWCSGEQYVDHRRRSLIRGGRWMDERQYIDDWTLVDRGWFIFRHAVLIRGPENIIIHLTNEEDKALLRIIDRKRAADRTAKYQEELAKKERAEQGQWWP